MTADNIETEARDDAQEQKALNDSVNYAQIAALIKTQYGGLLSLARRKLRDRELANDLINEAIVITLEHAQLNRLTHIERIGGYVFKVSMNLLRNRQRNTDNRQDLHSGMEVLETLALYERDEIETAQLREKARRLIESLSSPRDREVVKRFYLDEEEKQSICNDLRLTPLQFTQVISRARQRMKLIFDTEGLKRSDFFSLAML